MDVAGDPLGNFRSLLQYHVPPKKPESDIGNHVWAYTFGSTSHAPVG